MQACPLCTNTKNHKTIKGFENRVFNFCNVCYLLFQESKFHLNQVQEKNRYLKHNNSIDNAGYVNFLQTAITPALNYIPLNAVGLDYGCGPTPVLSQLMQKKGFNCHAYDPLFFPELNKDFKYDFIFATECFEHFFNPKKELQTLKKLLKPSAILVIMTDQWKDLNNIETWYYARDLTHVCFYHYKTFKYIANEYQLKCIFSDDKRITIFKTQIKF